MDRSKQFWQKQGMDALTRRIHSEITLSAAMQMEVRSEGPDHAILAAPLGPNTNDKGTAFGGSLNALATLACWTLVTRAAEEAGAPVEYLVIQDSSISFLKPVAGDFVAEARWIHKADREKFLATLSKHKLARAKVNASIRLAGGTEELVTFTGRFVAQLKR